MLKFWKSIPVLYATWCCILRSYSSLFTGSVAYLIANVLSQLFPYCKTVLRYMCTTHKGVLMAPHDLSMICVYNTNKLMYITKPWVQILPLLGSMWWQHPVKTNKRLKRHFQPSMRYIRRLPISQSISEFFFYKLKPVITVLFETMNIIPIVHTRTLFVYLGE